MAEEKIYVGSGKKHPKYDMVNINICISDIPEEFITTSDKNGKKYTRLVVSANRELDKNGNSHNVKVDTWKPDPNYKKDNNTPAQSKENDVTTYNPPRQQPDTDDLPF